MAFLCCRGGRRTKVNGNSTESEEDDGVHVEKFRRFWDEKLKDVVDLIRAKQEGKSNIFHVILQLYAHNHVVEQLYSCYEDDAQTVEFYIPQLCTFLLHGQYEKKHQLEFFLLSQCRRSLAFAHRLHWFLESFCANGVSYASEGLSATIEQPAAENAPLLAAIEMEGGVPAKLFSLGLTCEEVMAAMATAHCAVPHHPTSEDELKLPSSTESAFEFTAQAGTKDMAARNKELELAEAIIGCHDQLQLYLGTPLFVKALTDLADRLIPLPLVDRKDNLRQGLKEIEAALLPSSVIYLPIGDTFHRVKHIVAEESFAFSTKERVPYLMCVEVVDYVITPKKKQKRPKSRHRKSRSSHGDGFRYSMNLPFNKRVTVAMKDDLSSSQDEKDEAPEVEDSSDATTTKKKVGGKPPYVAVAAGNTPAAAKSPMSTVAMFPQHNDHPSEAIKYKTFVVESLRKSISVSLKEGHSDSDSDEGEVADDEDDNKKTMGQWAHRRSSSSSSKRGRKASRAKGAKTPAIGAVEEEDDEEDKTPAARKPESISSVNGLDPSLDVVHLGSPGSSGSDWEEGDFADKIERDEHVNGDGGWNSNQSKPVIVFRERWSEKEDRLRALSEYGNLPGWRLIPVIVKSNDDLRQEQFAAQLIHQCHKIFVDANIPLTLRPYDVIATSATSGFIEAVPDTVSLDSLKKNDPDYTTLLDFYVRYFGPEDSSRFKRARRNFVESLAAYSMVCYIFQIKDRHNGNILIDADGHVIHIDFGFLFTNSPGNNFNFERAPFKLTDEFVELMGGPRSSTFRYFRSLCVKAYWALHSAMDKLILLVEMMLVNDQAELRLPCFSGGKKATIDGLRDRLNPGLGKIACQEFANDLVDQSLNNWRTRWYDKYQYCCLGIL
ncbi:phosphatidylinositol kinase (PIK-J) [Thraustotheca clavata]|uniref:1-phosphatidylinositol 4-kinase n=1 Tax=Thraustotheca clavata TaxID=74557 RepID=A0A1V9Z3H6_9STRA|nr:phosphatidylinositol kinase (PIK-J) [Thraustotheca clavata]